MTPLEWVVVLFPRRVRSGRQPRARNERAALLKRRRIRTATNRVASPDFTRSNTVRLASARAARGPGNLLKEFYVQFMR